VRKRVLLVVCIGLIGMQGLSAQSPPLVPATGVVRDASGQPRVGAAAVTFAIYAEQEGGDALWSETQNLTLNAAGQYSTLLGVTQSEGLPTSLFTGSGPRWLGVSVDGGPEGPRMFWASVPYALKATDSQTLGGLPLSAFVLSGAYRNAASTASDPVVRAPGADADGTPFAAADEPVTAADQLVPDDLIVQSSLCVGFDCVEGEVFGFDTVRLKENNTRIAFQDTSVGTFPSNDWQLTANDSASGGLNKFSIDDVTSGRTPFTVEAGAPSHSLYISGAGRIGKGTNNPLLDVHMLSSNTPALRLEQNNAGGFTAQTWDVAANEAHFFVRDFTNGSKFPFRIRPNAPTSSIDVAATGNVGFGTAAPTGSVDISRNGTDVTMVLTNTVGSDWEMKNNAITGRLTFGPKGGFVPFKIAPAAGENLLRLGVLAANTVDINGNLVVTGQCSEVNGPCAPDYVFEPGYQLRPLADLEAYLKANKHLPGVPSAADFSANGINMRDMNYALLEKIEELVLYTLQQQKAIEELQERLRRLEAAR
jgi:hypothetical protein